MSESEPYSVETALKAQQWQITKGHLKAMVALVGSNTGGRTGDEAYKNYIDLQQRVEEFIENIENDGLVE